MSNLLDLIEKEIRVAMTLTGAKSIRDISADSLASELGGVVVDRLVTVRMAATCPFRIDQDVRNYRMRLLPSALKSPSCN